MILYISLNMWYLYWQKTWWNILLLMIYNLILLIEKFYEHFVIPVGNIDNDGM